MTQEQVKEEKKKGIFSKLKKMTLRTKKNNSPYFLRLLDWVS